MFRERFIVHFKRVLRLFLVLVGIGVFRIVAEQYWHDGPLRGRDIVLNALYLLMWGAVYASFHAAWNGFVPFARRCRALILSIAQGLSGLLESRPPEQYIRSSRIIRKA